MIRLYNTLTKQKEDFSPLNPSHVGMYVCGPTVYDRAHIGNGRAIVVFDTLYRLLCHHYGTSHVWYVRNITDVDDKINARAKEQHIPIQDLTDTTIALFHDDMQGIGCHPLHQNDPDSHRIEPKATQHIADMIAMCETLITRNHAYVASNHVLFDVSSFPAYGHLSRRTQDEMIAGARVEIAPYKKNPADFVLWKPSQHDEPGWESPWGRGRPGWHLECSAMSTKYLGSTFDIHGGGIDLQFPHHENEIAQSCCSYPESHFARYWIHNGFLTVNGEKMSKSLGNFITVRELLDKGVKGEVIRYLLLNTHYRKPLDWTDKGVSDAAEAVNYLYRACEGITTATLPDAVLMNVFLEALYDDLNTPKAIAYLYELASKAHKASGAEKHRVITALAHCAELIGLFITPIDSWSANEKLNYLKNNPFGLSQHEADEHINEYLKARNHARETKNWPEADRIRALLHEKGITIEDHPNGTSSWRIRQA